MIDQELISISTAYAEQSIANLKTINDDFKLVLNFLHPNLVYKLHEFINSTDEIAWETVPLQETLPRRSIFWVADSVIEEIHIITDNLTNLINQLFNTQDIKFQGLQLWRDGGGYSLAPHKDNPVIDIAMQIYLFECGQQYGTTFKINDKDIVVPFIHNSGYLLHKKSYEDRVLHWTTTDLPVGIQRYSLYLTWSAVSQ
jgi:hypothetical protein